MTWYDSIGFPETCEVGNTIFKKLFYDNVDLHIDLPLYAKHDGKVYLARGREASIEGNYSWEPADPKGLNDWLIDRINGNQQLRRSIRYIKKWKQEKYRNSTLDHEIPPSIGITLIAIDCFTSYLKFTL